MAAVRRAGAQGRWGSESQGREARIAQGGAARLGEGPILLLAAPNLMFVPVPWGFQYNAQVPLQGQRLLSEF